MSDPVRYPVGRGNMDQCIFSLKTKDDGTVDSYPLDYIEARKQIYVEEFAKLVKRHPKFIQLQQRLANGENLLIIEVDCCKEESMPYYIERYGVSPNMINNGTMLATAENLNLLLNDPRERFGHGMVIAGCLTGTF